MSLKKENGSTESTESADAVNTENTALPPSDAPEYEYADSKLVEQTAKRILEKYREAFEELAK